MWGISSISLAICLYSLLRLPRGGVLRLIAASLLIILLLRPQLVEETTTALPDIALIITDESASQQIDGREEATGQTVAELKARLSRFTDLEVREVNVSGRQETRLSDGFYSGLADIPRSQLAGVFVVTDGQSTDTPQSPAALGISAPVHSLLTGRANETDRVLEVISAPRYGIINERADIRFKVTDYGSDARLTIIRLKVNGVEAINRTVRVGEEIPLQAALDRPGKTILELIASPIDGELTTRNNRAVIEISVIRDRLRVLLVSGEPHAGERVWRNLLKSDPAVDLIHFTILKPATKPRIASEGELALIRFPENELFLEKLDEFDVVIFDRYTYRGVISPLHFDNISRYVRNGGAMLIASGPEFTGPTSIANRSNLSYILPALPNGQINQDAYIPLVSETGMRHPVTSTLENKEEWGRWLRSLGVEKRGGEVLLERGTGEPILLVDRVERGRVGLLLSDHVWLWAKDFDGGGPHRELLRRLVHWMMKEPELEEEAIELEVNAASEELFILRRSLSDEVGPVRIEAPNGDTTTIQLNEGENGRWREVIDATEPGLYSATTITSDGRTLFDVAALGLATPPEFSRVVSTGEHLQSLVTATGGGQFRVRQDTGMRLPSIRQIKEGRPTVGRGLDKGWAGIVSRNASRIENVSMRDILSPWVWLGLLFLTLLATWLIEGGQKLFIKRVP